jgi:hypothetical protein
VEAEASGPAALQVISVWLKSWAKAGLGASSALGASEAVNHWPTLQKVRLFTGGLMGGCLSDWHLRPRELLPLHIQVSLVVAASRATFCLSHHTSCSRTGSQSSSRGVEIPLIPVQLIAARLYSSTYSYIDIALLPPNYPSSSNTARRNRNRIAILSPKPPPI